MSFTVVNRRLSGRGKSTENRAKFLRKVRKAANRAMKDIVVNGSVKDVDGENNSKKVRIPAKGLDQPFFHHDGVGGVKHIVVPGNKEYVEGDKIKRQGEGQGDGQGQGGSNTGEGEDDFEFELSKDEFLDMFFDDLELPNMTKQTISVTEEWQNRRVGFSPDGTKLNVIRTMRKGKGRRISLSSEKKKKLKGMQEEYDALMALSVLTEDQEDRIKTLRTDIERLKVRISAVPFLDDHDLMYNRWEKVPIPTTKAVIFCVMDVSASMGPEEKDLSKRFFMLLYHFLQKVYDRVDVVFIRHTQIAKEVDEEEFFYSKETGGTVVSSGLELMVKIIKKRYPLNEWNIFGCQASDGDNWYDDSEVCLDVMRSALLNMVQYYAYVQLGKGYRNPEQADLWQSYKRLDGEYDHFQMRNISSPSEIYPVFHELFKKR